MSAGSLDRLEIKSTPQCQESDQHSPHSASETLSYWSSMNTSRTCNQSSIWFQQCIKGPCPPHPDDYTSLFLGMKVGYLQAVFTIGLPLAHALNYDYIVIGGGTV